MWRSQAVGLLISVPWLPGAFLDLEEEALGKRYKERRIHLSWGDRDNRSI